MICLLSFVAVSCLAASSPTLTVRSRTGQFVIYSPHPTVPTLGQWSSSNRDGRVVLSPDPLTIACERIKAGLLRELSLPDRWQGRIHVRIRPDLPTHFVPVVASTRYAEGWQHAIELPERCDTRGVVRAVIQALLTELAHRHPAPTAPELPLWLVEGLSAQVLAAAGPDVVPEPSPLLSKLGDAFGQLEDKALDRRLNDDLRQLRDRQIGAGLLSFNDLSLPSTGLLEGPQRARYQDSARLFFLELQHLPGGAPCLAQLVTSLKSQRNWQTALLGAFSPHFSSLLEIEKWWAVAGQRFLVSAEPHGWPEGFTHERLNEVLQVNVQLQDAPDTRPRTERWNLQTLLTQTPLTEHADALRLRIRQLQALQISAASPLVPLVRGYLTTLQSYLDRHPDAIAPGQRRRKGGPSEGFVVRDTLRRLDDLDRRRTIGETQRAPPGAPTSARR